MVTQFIHLYVGTVAVVFSVTAGVHAVVGVVPCVAVLLIAVLV